MPATAGTSVRAALPGPLFRILGPLAICPCGTDLPLRGLEPLQRQLLAVLLLQPGTFWPQLALARALWGEHRRPGAGATIRATVYRLRRALTGDGARLTHTSGGYRFDASAEQTDVGQLASLAALGRAAWYDGHAGAAAALLGDAARLWRHPALADVPPTPILARQRDRLAREYRDVRDLLIDARLSLGQAAETIPVLRGLLAADPLNEHGWAQLMTALARTGDLPAAAAALRSARAAVARGYQRPPGPELAEAARCLLGAL